MENLLWMNSKPRSKAILYVSRYRCNALGIGAFSVGHQQLV